MNLQRVPFTQEKKKETVKTILLLVENKGNANLLSKFLSNLYHVVIPELGDQNAFERDFDLCIIDTITLKDLSRRIPGRKDRNKSRFLPFILLTSHDELKIYAPELGKNVDEIIVTPMEKMELQTRIENLLRICSLNDELERSNQELNHFAYVVSHDLQAPLRSVIGFIQLLDEKYRDKLDPTAQDYIHIVIESGKRMQNMIVDILAFARLNANKQDMTNVDCETLLAGVLSDLKFSIEEAKVTITHDQLPVVVGIKALLTQVFTNLLDNALKFRSANPPQIHISTREDETEFTFSVKDNGIGFDPKHTERLFLLFGRIHKQGEYEGHGIGLSTCKKIVTLHGGRIWADSKVGEGSTFFFTIPKKILSEKPDPRGCPGTAAVNPVKLRTPQNSK